MTRIALRLLVCGVFTLAVGTPASAQRPGTLFRHIVVSTGRIELGKVLDRAVHAPIVLDDSTVLLRPGTFGGAASITARLTPAGRLRAIVFMYGADTNYDAKRAEYVGDLGPPVVTEKRGDETRTIWEDARTRLVLAWRREGEAIFYFTVMEDLDLFNG